MMASFACAVGCQLHHPLCPRVAGAMVIPAGTIVVADIPVYLCVFSIPSHRVTHTKPLILYRVRWHHVNRGVVDSEGELILVEN